MRTYCPLEPVPLLRQKPWNHCKPQSQPPNRCNCHASRSRKGAQSRQLLISIHAAATPRCCTTNLKYVLPRSEDNPKDPPRMPTHTPWKHSRCSLGINATQSNAAMCISVGHQCSQQSFPRSKVNGLVNSQCCLVNSAATVLLVLNGQRSGQQSKGMHTEAWCVLLHAPHTNQH